MELTILFFLLLLLILKPVMLGNRRNQKKKIYIGRAGEQEWTGYVLIQIMKPKPTCATWKEKNATAGITLNGIEDNFLLIIILMLKLKLNMLGNRLCT